MGSKVKGPILEMAIELFAAEGYAGVGIREIAKAADVTPGSVFRLFDNKDSLFKDALEAARDRALDPTEFQKLLESATTGFASILQKAVRRWYSSLTPQSARLMTYAALSNRAEWRELASQRTADITRILAESIRNKASKSAKRRLNALAAARTLIMALLTLKSTHAFLQPGEKEREAVDQIIQQWVQGIALE